MLTFHSGRSERIVETDAPASTEVSLMRQGDRDVVHLVNYSPGRRAPGHIEVLEAPVPLRDVMLRLRRATQTGRVLLGRTGTDLPYEERDGLVSITVPRVDIHEVLVFEGDAL